MITRRSARGRSWRKRRLAQLVGTAAMITTAWLAALTWFAGALPQQPADARTETDAIVVLTGGTGRLEAGLQLMAENRAKRLFISGVALGVDVAALLHIARRSPGDFACCIAVGYQADDTAGNARETAAWMRQHGFRSLRLVTATYHMPRSLIEFRRAMPKIGIVPHPVFPPQFKGSRWWRWPGTATLIASEFNKYLIALARLGIDTAVRRVSSR